MELHPYDGIERRYHHTDSSPAQGLDIVRYLLNIEIPLPSEGVRYDLCFYSGGIGVLDDVAISLPATAELWARVIAALDAATPDQAIADIAWAEEFIWLVCGDAPYITVHEAAKTFINDRRRDFQSECSVTHRILFYKGSDVNDWIALWGDDRELNFVGFSQG